MDIQLKGIELLYYLMKRFNMSYNEAISTFMHFNISLKELKKHNQDLSFLDDLKVKDLNKYYINDNK